MGALVFARRELILCLDYGVMLAAGLSMVLVYNLF